MFDRALGKICQFHGYKEPKNLRDCVNNTDEVLTVVRSRIDDVENNRLPIPKIRTAKNAYPTINGKDIRCYLFTPKERQRCLTIMRQQKEISPYYLLYKSIRTGKIRYNGKFLRDYFSSNDQYLLAASRIKHGWTVERAIKERETKYSFHDNGMKGSEALRIKLRLKTRTQAMWWLKNKGLA